MARSGASRDWRLTLRATGARSAARLFAQTAPQRTVVNDALTQPLTADPVEMRQVLEGTSDRGQLG